MCMPGLQHEMDDAALFTDTPTCMTKCLFECRADVSHPYAEPASCNDGEACNREPFLLTQIVGSPIKCSIKKLDPSCTGMGATPSQYRR